MADFLKALVDRECQLRESEGGVVEWHLPRRSAPISRRGGVSNRAAVAAAAVAVTLPARRTRRCFSVRRRAMLRRVTHCDRCRAVASVAAVWPAGGLPERNHGRADESRASPRATNARARAPQAT